MWSSAMALRNVFDYANVMISSNYGGDLGDALVNMVNPNLDAGLPVLFAIRGSGGHAIVCDGYGFQSSTAYHHLNMGWGGVDDAWYNLPDIQASYTYSTVESCIYNIGTENGGEIVSGRVLDVEGAPVEGATVTATDTGSNTYSTVTDSRGIYAVANLPSSTSYTLDVEKQGLAFSNRSVEVGISVINTMTAGNRWGIDFTATGIDVEGYGTFVVDVSLENATWAITEHPASYQGVTSGGGAFSVSAPTGLYKVVFGEVAGYRSPASQTQAVPDQAAATFSGLYDGIPVVGVCGDMMVAYDELLAFTVTASDPDGTIPALGMEVFPEGATLVDHGTGEATFNWTPGASDDGTYSVRFVASDGSLATSNSISILVSPSVPWPSGVTISNRRPTFTWVPIDGATFYQICINRNGSTYHREWLAQTANTWQPDFDLRGGEYRWWILAWGPATGYGTWSDAADFTLPVVMPGTGQPQLPDGIADSDKPTFEWTAGSNATWHCLWLSKDGHKHAACWIEGTNTFEYPEALSLGSYEWWIRTWNTDGYGPWSDSKTFALGLSDPLSPTGTVEATRLPEFTWTEAGGATWYRLWISRDNAEYFVQWFQGVTNWTPLAPLPYGRYQWWVQTWKSDGYGPWSDAASFKVGAARPLQPSGALGGSPVELGWDDAGSYDATWYQLWLNRDGVAYWSDWVTREETTDGGSDERYYDNIPVFPLPSGTYTWWIRAWNSTGYGSWSEPTPFSVP